MPTFSNLNDPFEFKSFYLKEDILKKYGWPIDFLKTIFERISQSMLLTCFSSDLTNNMPLWAHYANNHKGFCVEYKINNSYNFYPVFYESNRNAIASIITHFVSDLNDLFTKDIDKVDLDKLQYNSQILFHSAVVKHESWKYENEYRAIYSNEKWKKYGDLISLGKIGAEASKIFIGFKCSKLNKEKLIQISKKIGCNAYDMYFDELMPTYSISYRQLI